MASRSKVYVLMLTDLRCDSDSADWVEGVYSTEAGARVAGRTYREYAINTEVAEPSDISFQIYPKSIRF